MDRESIKGMAGALKAYSKVKCLSRLSENELASLPKEVIIACASEEIAHVWDRLPKYLKDDPHMQKYQFCHDHHGKNNSSENQDIYDGPPPRKLYCCYCNIKDIHFSSKNSISTPTVDKFAPCCEIL